MAFSARRNNGVEISFRDTKVILDPGRGSELPVFVTHAHGDHCKGLKSSSETYSTRATFELARATNSSTWKIKPENHFIENHEKIRCGDIEVRAHNAGHVLGSTQFELISPQGNAVFTGDINFRDTLMMRRAEVAPCDLLIIESTYGTPCYFPSQEFMYERIVDWTRFIIRKGKIPTFQTDALGNAQELIALLNKFTKLPIVTHPKIARYSDVYQRFGHRLSYVAHDSEEGKEILDSKECTWIMPKNTDLRELSNVESAFVSGWGSKFAGRRKAFSLSDHSDFYRLIEFVEETRPRMVLTCHGNLRSKLTLAKSIWRTLHIPASPLTRNPQALSIRVDSVNPTRMNECVKDIMLKVRPGFTYPRKWLISTTCRGLRQFNKREVERGLNESVKNGKLRYDSETDAYERSMS